MPDHEPQIALCWGTAMGASLETLIEAAARHELGAITVTSGMYEKSRAAGRTDQELRRLLLEHEVRVHAIDPLISALPGTPRPEDVPAEHRHYFQFSEDDCYRAAAALEAETINLAHFGGGAVSEAAFIDCVGAIATRAQGHGVRLTLEFLPESAIPDLATAARIVGAIRAPNLGVMLDTWHFARSGGTLAQLQELPAALVTGLQLSDRVEPPAGSAYTPMFGRLLPGEGELPLAPIVKLLLGRDPKLTVGVEVFSEELLQLPADEIAGRVALATRGVLARAAGSTH
jgi:sugar phosphate isomerase/epimerase